MKIFACDAGAFGTAVAVILARVGHDVRLLVQPFDQKHRDMFYNIKYGAQRCNYLHLPGVELPKMEFTDNFEGVKDADVVLLGVPSRYVWDAFLKIKAELGKKPKAIIALLTKGLDDYGKLPFGMKMSNLLKLEGNNNFAVLSGYTPAHGLAVSQSTQKFYAASVASKNLNVIKKLRQLFRGTNLGIVGTTDIAGVSLGGALKNTYAIGYGILLGLNQNEKAWKFLSSALEEMTVFFDYFGADRKTISTPAVRGDFYGTSVGEIAWESRNVSFGKFLALRPTREAIARYIAEHTVEGYESALTLWKISREQKLKTPILDEIYSVCTGASPC